MPNQTPSVLQPILFVAGGQQVSTIRRDECTDRKAAEFRKHTSGHGGVKHGKKDEEICLREETFCLTWTLPASLKAGWMWMWTLVLPCSSSSYSVSSCWWPYSAVLRWCWTLTALSPSPCTRQSNQGTD